MSGWIKYMRSEESEYLLANPCANHLLQVIALRARRTDHPMSGLKAGQCFLGDYKKIGLTERQYRTAKKRLAEWTLVTFKGTSKGTVATLLNTRVYDINGDTVDGQETDKGRTVDGQETTNKECKKERSKNVNKNTCVITSVEVPTVPDDCVAVLPTNKNGEWYKVTREDFDLWADTYQAVDVMAELRNMYAWSDANPQKKKTAGGMKRFITNWLKRVQDKGGSINTGQPNRSNQLGGQVKNGGTFSDALFAQQSQLDNQEKVIQGETL